jgi:hypothetical protein
MSSLLDDAAVIDHHHAVLAKIAGGLAPLRR